MTYIKVIAVPNHGAEHFTVHLPGGRLELKLDKYVRARLSFMVFAGKDAEGKNTYLRRRRHLAMTPQEARRAVLRAAVIALREDDVLTTAQLTDQLNRLNQTEDHD